MTKVVPVNFDDWEKEISAFIDALSVGAETNDVPETLYDLSKSERVVASALMLPVCCSGCFCWSTFWRCFCCPYMCGCKGGARMMCSNNSCTDCTDNVIISAYDELSVKRQMPHHGADVASMSEDHRARMLVVVRRIKGLLGAPSTSLKRSYLAAEVLGPAFVPVEKGSKCTLAGLSAEVDKLERSLKERAVCPR